MNDQIPERPRHHKSKDRGYVRILLPKKAGEKRRRYRQKYFAGPYGSIQMWDDFNAWRRRQLGQLAAGRATLDQAARFLSVTGDNTVSDICTAYMSVLEKRRRHGRPEQNAADRAALTQARLSIALLEPFFDMMADDFNSQHLREARENEVARGNSRKTINGKVATICRVFRQAVADRRCHDNTYGRLLALEKLGRLDRTVPGPRKVHAADAGDVEATASAAPPTIACMIRVQAATGMRSANLCEMSFDQIDRSREDEDGVWIYSPKHHKTEHLGKSLRVVLGPDAIEAILNYQNCRPDRDHPFLFNPRATRAWRYYTEDLSGRTWEAIYKASTKSDLNDHLSTKTYCEAVQRVQRREGIGKWTPHQLRHLYNQSVCRGDFGDRGAQAALGHTTLQMTREVYGESQNLALAVEVQKVHG